MVYQIDALKPHAVSWITVVILSMIFISQTSNRLYEGHMLTLPRVAHKNVVTNTCYSAIDIYIVST